MIRKYRRETCPRNHPIDWCVQEKTGNRQCRGCEKERSALRKLTPEWKAYHRQYSSKAYYKSREIVIRGKMKPCTDCGVQYNPWVMEYDHRDPSDKKFSLSRGTVHNENMILEEISKCDVVCANCHAERTHKKHRYKDKKYTDDLRKNSWIFSKIPGRP
jgi:hypothetical protein